MNGRCRFVDPEGNVLDQVKVLEEIRVLNESDLDELLSLYQVPGLEELGKAVQDVDLREIPKELPARFVDRLKTDTKLRDAWEGRRKPPRDESRSGYDSMLAGMLAVRGFTDEEIASILLHYANGRGADGNATPYYLSHTIAKAKAWAAQLPPRDGQNQNSTTEEHPSAEIQLLDDPVFVDPALAFVGDEVFVSRSFREIRTREEGKGSEKKILTFEVWTPRMISSTRRIIEIPQPVGKVREEILPLGNGHYLRHRPDSAPTRWSISSIQEFISGRDKIPAVTALYDEIMGKLQEFCYFPDEYTYHLVTLYIIGTYFFELFPAFPYLNFNGPGDSGKSTVGRFIAALAFNALLLIDPSEASLFRTVEREKPCLIIDEKENAATREAAALYPGLMALLKAGYQKGARVSRQNTKDVGRTEYYSVYSPKVICNINGLEDVLQDRSIIIITQAAPKGHKIREVQPDPNDPEWEPIRDHLYLALMHFHDEIRELRDADMVDDLARLREKELFAPLVVIASWVDAHRSTPYAVPAVVEALSSKRDARAFTRNLTPEAILCAALSDLLDDDDAGKFHTGGVALDLQWQL